MAGSEGAPSNTVTEGEVSLKDQGNEFFKAGNYLKAAALYTQAIKQDPNNATLYRFASYSLFLFALIMHLGMIHYY